MFVFILFSNVLNYVAIGTNDWLSYSFSPQGSQATTQTSKSIWTLDINVYALIATGTALNILSLIFGFLSLLSLCITKIRESFAIYFIFACLVTSLLALLFNATGWYMITVNNVITFSNTNTLTKLNFGYSYWLMTPSFGCDVLAAVFASCIIGCSFALNKFNNQQKHSLSQPSNQYQIATKPATFNNEGIEPRPTGIQTTTYSYQNETYQNEQRVLRL